jgi:hypothetical protein
MRARFTLAIFVCAIGAYAFPALGQTDVLPGYDLLETTAGTNFAGEPFEGVPIGSYNFGGAIGVQNVGETDTIIQRPNTSSIPGNSGDSGAQPLLFDDLQLESATPFSFGGGPVGFYFITLQSQDGTGPASTGSIDINFTSPAGGTFTSSLDVFFDVHYGALNGPIVFNDNLVLSNSGDTWGRIPPPGAVLIDGANNLLNGVDHSEDFFVAPPLIEMHPAGPLAATHVVQEAQVPEPASLSVLAGMGLLALRRPRKKSC